MKNYQSWFAVCFAALALPGLALAADTATDLPAPSGAEEKVQRIGFIEDDAQSYMYSKIYVLKHAKATDIAPFVLTATQRCNPRSTVSAISDAANNRELLLVNTKVCMLESVDSMVAALDRPGKLNSYGSLIEGTGVAYGTYSPKFRGNEKMRDIIVYGGISSGEQNSTVRFDGKTGLFYFKDTPSLVLDIKEKLSWLDRPAPQAKIEFKIYQIRESDLRDIGIDYMAWKNGPGLNLFSAGYEALSLKAAEMLISEAFPEFLDLAGNFTYGFGGFYTAPAFDLSFVRVLEQDGKAVINSTASVMVSNSKEEYNVSFSPEYQQLAKDPETHQSSLNIGGDSTLSATISDVVVTGKVVNFNYAINGQNVVERNSMDAEISARTSIESAVTLDFEHEKVLADWNKTSKVEQTIGVPFLCELPILKYIFGTTTENEEIVRYVVTAKAVDVKHNQPMDPGVAADFDDLVKR